MVKKTREATEQPINSSSPAESPPSPLPHTTATTTKTKMKRGKKPKATRSKSSSQKEEEPATSAPKPDPGDLKNVDFEEMFYKRSTQKTVYDLLLKEKVQSGNLYAAQGARVQKTPRGGSGMKLRSSDPDQTVAGAQDGPATGVPEKEEPVDLEEQESIAMVQELMNRYTYNKVKDKKEKMMKAVNNGADVEFDYDELLYEDDLDAEGPNNASESDFLKYTIPQWEIKEKLWQMHFKKIEQLHPEELVKICKEVIPELDKIMKEEVQCKRHEIFKTCGISKQSLRDMTVARPFTQYDDSRVLEVISDSLLAHRDIDDLTGELLHYVSCVLVPEALIRIYSMVNSIPLDLAEKELRFKSGYDGILDEAIINTLNAASDEEDAAEGPVDKENVF